MKAINENLLTCGCVRSCVYACNARECARSCVNWGESWKSGEECERKWGGMREKVGRGEGKGGMRDGRGADSEVKMGEGVSEEESPSRKDGLVLRKGERGGKRVGRALEKIARNRVQNGEGQEKRALRRAKNGSSSPKKRPKLDAKRGQSRKKSTSWGKKRACSLVKSPKIGFRMEKSKKKGDLGTKKVGWG